MIWKVVTQIVRTGICTEAAPDIGEVAQAEAARIQAELLCILGQALTIRQVDAGSCNGCELEINALGAMTRLLPLAWPSFPDCVKTGCAARKRCLATV